jgi:hypothetical protein
MALVSVQKQDLQSYSVDQGKTRQSTDYYLVTFDAPATAVQAEMAAGVPVYGNASPDDPIRLFKQKRPQCVDNSNRKHWLVQVDYDSTIDPQPNPLLRPRAIAWDYGDATETYFVDHGSMYGDQDFAVCNSANQPWDKLLDRDAGTWSATFTKNVATSFTIASEINIMQLVNSDEFTFDGQTIAKYTAKISGGSLSAVTTENGFNFRTLVYKVKFKNGGWIDRLEDRGYQQLGTDGKPTDIVLGIPPLKVTKPAALDGSGHVASDQTKPGPEIDFYPYKNTAFAPLGFT